jgi:hypothetical protein
VKHPYIVQLLEVNFVLQLPSKQKIAMRLESILCITLLMCCADCQRRSR